MLRHQPQPLHVFFFFLFGIFLIVANCGVEGGFPKFGSCPSHTLSSDFSWRKFSGKWYEIERFFAIFEIGRKCVTSEFAQLHNGDIRFVGRGINKWTKTNTLEYGTGKIIDPTEPGKFSLAIRKLLFNKIATFHVLDTDYNNYAVIWSCKRVLGFFYSEYAWVLSRQRILTEELRLKIYDKLDELGVNKDKLYLTDQHNCPEGH